VARRHGHRGAQQPAPALGRAEVHASLREHGATLRGPTAHRHSAVRGTGHGGGSHSSLHYRDRDRGWAQGWGGGRGRGRGGGGS
jgi:hypothetical protein